MNPTLGTGNGGCGGDRFPWTPGRQGFVPGQEHAGLHLRSAAEDRATPTNIHATRQGRSVGDQAACRTALQTLLTSYVVLVTTDGLFYQTQLCQRSLVEQGQGTLDKAVFLPMKLAHQN